MAVLIDGFVNRSSELARCAGWRVGRSADRRDVEGLVVLMTPEHRLSEGKASTERVCSADVPVGIAAPWHSSLTYLIRIVPRRAGSGAKPCA